MINSTSYIQKINNTVTVEHEVKCNACPRITFKKNNKGFMERSDLKTFPFHWRIEDDKLVLINSVKDSGIVKSGTYVIISGKNKSIQLLDSIHKIAYNLD